MFKKICKVSLRVDLDHIMCYNIKKVVQAWALLKPNQGGF